MRQALHGICQYEPNWLRYMKCSTIKQTPSFLFGSACSFQHTHIPARTNQPHELPHLQHFTYLQQIRKQSKSKKSTNNRVIGTKIVSIRSEHAHTRAQEWRTTIKPSLLCQHHSRKSALTSKLEARKCQAPSFSPYQRPQILKTSNTGMQQHLPRPTCNHVFQAPKAD